MPSGQFAHRHQGGSCIKGLLHSHVRGISTYTFHCFHHPRSLFKLVTLLHYVRCANFEQYLPSLVILCDDTYAYSHVLSYRRLPLQWRYTIDWALHISHLAIVSSQAASGEECETWTPSGRRKGACLSVSAVGYGEDGHESWLPTVELVTFQDA